MGWRDEPYPLRDTHGGEHGTLERAASRFWGMLTLDFAVRHRLIEPNAPDREPTEAGASATGLTAAQSRAFEALRPRGLGLL